MPTQPIVGVTPGGLQATLEFATHLPTMPRPFRPIALLALLALLAACGKDKPPGLASVDAHPDGYWQDTRFPQGTGILDETTRRKLERLANLGYSDGVEPARPVTGVTRWEVERSQPGLNLYCSGHGPEAILMDMAGEVLHRWHLPFEAVPSKRTPDLRTQLTWRKVHLFDNGDLLACYEGLGLVRIDSESRMLWYWDGAAHHDFEVRDGRVYTLAREPRYLPYLRNPSGVVEDWVCVLDATTGREIERHSLYQALFESPWSATLVLRSETASDVLHTNSIEAVGEDLAPRIPGARPEDWLLVFRDIHALAILAASDGRIVWYEEGPWKGPHSASPTPNGNVLLFDNMGQDGFTRLLEWDPIGDQIAWQYHGSPPESFVSIFSGNVHWLANGNRLTAVSCAGYAQELTPSGEVVWEFQSPHRAGKAQELVAVLFDMERLDPGQVAGWLNRRK